MPFSKFQEAWQSGSISDQYSYTVEEDYWNWEAAVSDEQALQDLSEEVISFPEFLQQIEKDLKLRGK